MGDIHGAYLALLQCLERSGFNKETDTLIQLGDVCDGWPDTYEVIQELLTIPNNVWIRGNHDHWTYMWMDSGQEQLGHRGQGGQATMDSYLKHGAGDPYFTTPEHFNFLKNQHNYYIDDKNRLFVHGGINRDYPVTDGSDVHNYSWNRSFWKQALSCADGVKLKTADNFEEVFIGHTTTMMWDTDKPMFSGGVWNLDTGAGYKGRLTIMDLETKEYWQSDPVNTLYKEFPGRN